MIFMIEFQLQWIVDKNVFNQVVLMIYVKTFIEFIWLKWLKLLVDVIT
jgi:hypothetical protein